MEVLDPNNYITKVCISCKVEKPLEEFRYIPTSHDGRAKVCKECKKKERDMLDAVKEYENWITRETKRPHTNGKAAPTQNKTIKVKVDKVKSVTKLTNEKLKNDLLVDRFLDLLSSGLYDAGAIFFKLQKNEDEVMKLINSSKEYRTLYEKALITSQTRSREKLLLVALEGLEKGLKGGATNIKREYSYKSGIKTIVKETEEIEPINYKMVEMVVNSLTDKLGTGGAMTVESITNMFLTFNIYLQRFGWDPSLIEKMLEAEREYINYLNQKKYGQRLDDNT